MTTYEDVTNQTDEELVLMARDLGLPDDFFIKQREELIEKNKSKETGSKKSDK